MDGGGLGFAFVLTNTRSGLYMHQMADIAGIAERLFLFLFGVPFIGNAKRAIATCFDGLGGC